MNFFAECQSNREQQKEETGRQKDSQRARRKTIGSKNDCYTYSGIRYTYVIFHFFGLVVRSVFSSSKSRQCRIMLWHSFRICRICELATLSIYSWFHFVSLSSCFVVKCLDTYECLSNLRCRRVLCYGYIFNAYGSTKNQYIRMLNPLCLLYTHTGSPKCLSNNVKLTLTALKTRHTIPQMQAHSLNSIRGQKFDIYNVLRYRIASSFNLLTQKCDSQFYILDYECGIDDRMRM